MAGHFNHDVVAALNDAVIKVFWTRSDMRRMLQIAGVDQDLICEQDWRQYKYHILSPIVDALNVNEETLGPLRRVLQETLRYKDCSHLLRYGDGKKLKREAEHALEHLRALVKDHDSAKATADEERETRRRRIEESGKGRIFQEKLGRLHDRYMGLLVKQDENERGYDLEKLLNEIFALSNWRLTPRSDERVNRSTARSSWIENISCWKPNGKSRGRISPIYVILTEP